MKARRYRSPATPHSPHEAKVLVMEWLDGVSVGEARGNGAGGPNPRELAERLMRSSMQQMLIDGHFPADPHPGNVLVLDTGELGLIDFGAAGRLDAIEQGDPDRDQGRPRLHQQDLPLRILRLLGLFCSAVLVMRVLIAILRDGLN
jgi:hypothetical protein